MKNTYMTETLWKFPSQMSSEEYELYRKQSMTDEDYKIIYEIHQYE